MANLGHIGACKWHSLRPNWIENIELELAGATDWDIVYFTGTG